MRVTQRDDGKARLGHGRIDSFANFGRGYDCGINLQLHHTAGAEGFVGGEDDAQAVDRILHVIGEIDVVDDGIEEDFLLTGAEAVVIRLFGAVEDLVRAG